MGHEGLKGRYEAPEAAQHECQGVEKGADATLEAARRADARQAPHEQTEIQAAGVDQKALADVGVPPQMHPTHPSGLIEVRVRSLEALATPAEQPSSTGPTGPPPVGIHGVADGELAAPATPATVRLRHVAASPRSASATIVSLL